MGNIQDRKDAWDRARAEAIRVAVRGPDYDPSSDVFLAALDPQDLPSRLVVDFSGYRNRTRIPKPEHKVHPDYTGAAFYKSQAWRALRYLAIKTYGRKCMCCGAAGAMHVDHISPRSRYPSLELDIRNLQILCEDCNTGKGAWDETDWRTSQQRAAAIEAHGRCAQNAAPRRMKKRKKNRR